MAAAKEIKEMLDYVHAYLRHNGINVSANDLKEPKFERIASVYAWFVSEIYECSDNVFSQMTSCMPESCNSPSLHEFSAPMLALVLTIGRILDDTGYTDVFVMTDLLNPTSSKTVRVLAHLCRFHQFRLERRPRVEALLARQREKNEEKKQLQAEVAQLRQRVAVARNGSAERDARMNQLQRKREQLAASLIDVTSQANAARQKSDQIDAEIKTLEENIRDEETEFIRLKKEDELLSSQIVSSPERLHEEMNSLSEQKQKAASETLELKKKLVEMKNQQREMPRIVSQLEALTIDLDSLLAEKEKLEAIQQEIERSLDERAQLDYRVKSKELEATKNKELLNERTKVLEELECQRTREIHSIQLQIADMEAKLSAVERERQDNEIAAMGLDEVYAEKKAELAMHQKKLDEFRETMRAVYAKMVQQWPLFFVRRMDFTIFRHDVLTEDRIYEYRLKNVEQYTRYAGGVAVICRIIFPQVEMQVLSVTPMIDDGTVRLRWRVCYMTLLDFIVMLVQFKPFTQQYLRENGRWFDGYSTYYADGNGAVYKHIIDRVMPDDGKNLNKRPSLRARLQALLGAGSKQTAPSPGV